MLFNSIHFAFFFVLVTCLYFYISHSYRWLLLLASSCYFYMSFIPVYILILFFTIVIDYFAGIYLEKTNGPNRKLLLVVSLLSNILILCFFKYYYFLNDNLTVLLGFFHEDNPIPYLSIILPIGLSFHTFQAMSYTIEVYRGNQKAEQHFGYYSLYVMFYPQLVAGPIERPQNILHQLHEKHTFDYSRVVDGLKLMAWGLFKKIVIADRLATVVDPVFNFPNEYNGLETSIAVAFFSFQIFCDFSGYSDIAIGSARVMGIDLMKNFDRPYHSTSIQEFWKRWHISLSSWFRDYLYLPLGGSRVVIPRWYLNLFITFLISGLWHGANLTFVIWGALHGFYLVFGIVSKKSRQKLDNVLGLGRYPVIDRLAVFILVSLAWIFFRADNLQAASLVFRNLAFRWDISSLHFFTHIKWETVCLSLVLIGIMEYVHSLDSKRNVRQLIATLPRPTRWALYYAFVGALFYLAVLDDRQFIYFQF